MHQNLLRLILNLIGKRERQHVTWRHLQACSEASLDRFTALGILQGPVQRDYVIDPTYGPGPIPVVYVDGAYYLSSTDPNGPDLVEIDERMLEEYHLDTAVFLSVFAEQNEIEPTVEMRDSGLWQVGRWQKDGDDLLVLFAPAGFPGHLLHAVAEAERVSPVGRTLLLVPFRTSLDGTALDLDDRRVLTLVLEDALTPDLRLRLPANFLRTRLEVFGDQKVAYWEGRLLNIGEADFFVLQELASRLGQPVSMRELRSIRGMDRMDVGVRQSIIRLRKALCEADPTVDQENATRILRTVRGVGYQLALAAQDVRHVT